MFRPHTKPKPQQTWKTVFALLCVLLVLAFGTIQAVHVHTAGDVSHPDCALCATAHLAVQFVAPAVILHVASITTAVETASPTARSKTFNTFALFTRPPPVDAASA